MQHGDIVKITQIGITSKQGKQLPNITAYNSSFLL